MSESIIFATDGYKPSHFLQDPPGTTSKFAYIEARKGEETLWFGLQAIIEKHLATPITLEDIDVAEKFYAAYGVPFNRAGWERILEVHRGYMPVIIRSAPEGLIIPTKNVLATIETTDPELPWVASYVETALLRVWYPTTVATKSMKIKRVIKEALERSGDVAGLPWKLHNFGARGVSSGESAEIGGMAHLANFMGSDTIEGIIGAMRYYGAGLGSWREQIADGIMPPSGSIPASEHSTMTAWGRDGEEAAYANMIEKFGGPGKVFACVSDSYNIYDACDKLWGESLKQKLVDSGATLVVRPDSGNPAFVLPKVMRILDARFGSVINAKGYRVLNNVRVIWGDGIENEGRVSGILESIMGAGFSADNIAFGMGGGLLQHVNRDDYGFAMKTSAVKVNGQWRDVFKDPVDDPGKASKRGIFSLQRNTAQGLTTFGQFATVGVGDAIKGPGWADCMNVVYANGPLPRRVNMQAVRENTGLW